MLSKLKMKKVYLSGLLLVLSGSLMACGQNNDEPKHEEVKQEVKKEYSFKEKPVTIDYSKAPEEILANYTEKGMNLFKANFPDTLSMNYALKNIGKEAPNISAKTIDGKTVQLSKLKGKNVLISFSKTTCSICKEMAPIIKQIASANKNLVILNVYPVDKNKDIKAYYKGLKQEIPANTLSLEDNKGLKSLAVDKYQIEQVPTYVFVDNTGKISYTYIGNKDVTMFQDMINTAFGDEKLYDNVRTVTVRVDKNGKEVTEEHLIDKKEIDKDGVDHTESNTTEKVENSSNKKSDKNK